MIPAQTRQGQFSGGEGDWRGRREANYGIQRGPPSEERGHRDLEEKGSKSMFINVEAWSNRGTELSASTVVSFYDIRRKVICGKNSRRLSECFLLG